MALCKIALVVMLILTLPDRLCQSYIGLFPLNPSIIRGNVLNMVCYIWPNKCSQNSTDLKFVFNLTNGTKISVSRRHTTVVNATTVELNYPNITLQFNGAVVTCRVRGRGTLCRDSVDNRLDVGDGPSLPVITGYWMYNWSRYFFTWTHGNNSQYFIPDYTAWYRSSVSDWVKCIDQSTQRCIVSNVLKFTHPKHVICFKVNASNLFGIASTNKTCVDLNDTNRPGPVDNLSVNISSMTNISGLFVFTLRFVPSKRNVRFSFHVHLNCSWHSQDLHFENVLSRQQLVVSPPFSVPAYTLCIATVKCRHLNYSHRLQGYWSEPSQLSFHSPQTVPLTAVKTCSSCYNIYLLNSAWRQAVIYFQLLSCREARGVVIGYRVVSTVRQVNVANCPHGEITPMNTTMLISNRSISHRFNVSPCASYVVTINARTTVGFNETLRLNKIVIPSRAEVPRPAMNVTSVLMYNYSVVRLSWRPLYDVDDSCYTVFWCPSSDPRVGCTGQIQWAEVEKSKFLYDVNVSSATGRLYGVAVKHAGAHSGPVLWTSCLYDISQRPLPPDVTVKSTTDSSATLFIQKSLCTQQLQGFTYKFNISYSSDGARESVMVLDSDVDDGKLTVSGLFADTNYTLSVAAVSVVGQSEHTIITSVITNVTTDTVKLTAGHITAVAVVAPVFIVLALIGVYACARGVKLLHCNVLQISLKTPEKYVQQHLDTYSSYMTTVSYCTTVPLPVPSSALTSEKYKSRSSGRQEICLVQTHTIQQRKPEDRILPCLDDSDEAESSSESCDVISRKDSSSSLSADESEVIAASRKRVNSCESFRYVAGVPSVVNVFSLPPGSDSCV